MSNDMTTLADVQPGGRVRLGDQAELDRLEFQAWARELLPCPFCGNSAEFVPYKDNGLTLKCTSMGCVQRNQRTLRYGIDWLRTSMAEHWNTRALSAQPSPGGQGESVTDEMVDAACRAYYDTAEDAVDVDHTCMEAALKAALAARSPVRIYGCCFQPEGELHTDDCPNLRHLAARQPVASNQVVEDLEQLAVDTQPVGEPVAVEVPQGAIINGAAFADRLEHDYQFECPAGPLANCTDYVEFRRCFDFLAQWASSLPPLYAVPTAQAVDLGELRKMLDGWKNSDYPFSYEGQCAQRALDACVADLQGWLDSQAVGK